MPHLLYIAVGFPPAAKSGAHRMLAAANLWAEQGWDVTALTIDRRSWLRETGLDLSMEARLDPRVRTVELPLARVDLEPDLRKWSWLRARHSGRWLDLQRRLEQRAFPEKVFGAWRPALEQGALQVHAEHPVDLAVVSPAPYVQLPAALALHEQAGVPFVVDFRDAWSLDVVGGGEAFARSSPKGVWEERVVRAAEQVWTVNDPIHGHYDRRYPELASKFRTVRNGYDANFLEGLTVREPDPVAGLDFGYVGTATLPPPLMVALLQGWAKARKDDPLVARSRLVFRGHIGAGHTRGANAHAAQIAKYAGQAVSYLGPVPKAELAAVYSGFDALVLPLIGGAYMTSGKVYEYAATGLPIVSVHEREHDAATVLADYPLWSRVDAVTADEVAAAFVRSAQQTVSATPEVRAAAREVAARYERRRLMEPAIAELAARTWTREAKQVTA